MSRTTDVIAWENHRAWYESAVRIRRRLIDAYVKVCGMHGRFDLTGQDFAEININLIAMRRKKLARQSSPPHAGTDWIPHTQPHYAEVKPRT